MRRMLSKTDFHVMNDVNGVAGLQVDVELSHFPFIHRVDPSSISCVPDWRGLETIIGSQTKTDVAEHPQVFNRVGLLVNEPPYRAAL
jgi:hypothetical protein